MASILQHEFADALRRGKSSPPRSFRQWVESELIIPDGPHKGERFRIERQPAIGLWIDAVDDPQWQDLVFTAVTQFGKSLFGYVSPTLYHACELGQSIGFCVPFADMADNKWQADVRPVMIASPNLRRMLPTRGSGSSGGKVRDMVQLANGAILKIFSAGADDTGKAGFTTPTLAITEAAGFSQAGGMSVEADPLRQVRGRQRSYKRNKRRTYIEGTLTIETELPWVLYEASTKTQIVSPCPHCKTFIAPGRKHLVGWKGARSEIAAANSATWICPECEKKITEEQRFASLKNAVLLHHGQSIDKRGRIRGPKPESTRLWYHATPWVNCLLGASDVATDEWLADQIPEDTAERELSNKELSQFVWSQVYKPPKNEEEIEITRDSVAARRMEIGRGQLPSDVDLLATAYDLGDRTGWYLSLASRKDGRLFIPDYGSFDVPSDRIHPTAAIKVALMDQLSYLQAGYSVLGGSSLRPHQVWADAGHRRQGVWEFTREANEKQKLHQWIIACRGRGETQMDERKYTCPTKKGGTVRQIAQDRTWYVEWLPMPRVFEIHWDADKYKWLAQHGMSIDINQPGAIGLFAGPEKIHRTLARHMCNEQLVTEVVPFKGERKRWIRTGANHLLDCLAEAYAALCRLGYRPPSVKFDGDFTQESEPEETTDADDDDDIAKKATRVRRQIVAATDADQAAAAPRDPQRDKVRGWFSKQ